MNRPLFWRFVEWWLTRQLPEQARSSVLGDLVEDYRRDRQALGRLRAEVRLLREVGTVVSAYRSNLRTPREARTLLGGLRWRSFIEVRRTWRGVRARGWRAVLVISLLAVALSASTLMFAAADSLVFHPVPYRDADQLIAIADMASGRAMDGMTPDLLDQWRQQRDLFGGVDGYRMSQVFLTGEPASERVPTIDTTPGLLGLLGGSPQWGRSLVPGDERAPGADVVVIAEELARARFGDPVAAVGQKLDTTDIPLHVVGVMPRTFRFPSGSHRIWRAFDPRGSLGLHGELPVNVVALLAVGMDQDSAGRAMAERSAGIATAAGLTTRYQAVPVPMRLPGPGNQGLLFRALLGAALCLLLIACINVANLELANALARARTYAIHLGLGASRGRIIVGVLLEGTVLTGAALLVAFVLIYFGQQLLLQVLPEQLVLLTVNPIDVDYRALGFMTLLAFGVWIVASLPAALSAGRADLMDLLKREGRSLSASTASNIVRRTLTTAEIALAVILLAGSVLYTRTYIAMLRVDKGFDTANLWSLSLTVPPELLPQRAWISGHLLEKLHAAPGVLAISSNAPPAQSNTPSSGTALEIDGMPTPSPGLSISEKMVSPDYFQVFRIPVRAGRPFESDDLRTDVVVSETLAKRFWPAGAIGHSFRLSPRDTWKRVVGVVGHVRRQEDGWSGPNAGALLFYTRLLPPVAPQQSAPPPPRNMRGVNGPSYGFMAFTVRLDSPARLSEVIRIVRTSAPEFALRTQLVDDQYAEWAQDTRLAMRLVGGFAGIAFLIAMAGVYGVMAFLVVLRTREIGIRLALGADRTAVTRLILGSSFRLVLLGAVLGVVSAIVASRWIQSHLFGVTSTDPTTYLFVTAAVVSTGLLATWHPTRQAARINPALTLKAE